MMSPQITADISPAKARGNLKVCDQRYATCGAVKHGQMNP